MSAESESGRPPLLEPGARVAVVGAGFSGVVTARFLQEEGYDVTVFEKAADIGGVWSASRAYPGISTQDDRVTYAFSDTPMPADVAPHPAGADVRRYLEGYADRARLTDRIRLRTEVRRARLVDGRVWRVETDGVDGPSVGEYDWLVAAHGTFSTPHVPDWPGRAAFEAAGGTVLEPAALGDGGVLDGRRVVVVGWGKTACDIAAASADRAAATAVIVRSLNWKYPKRLGVGTLTHRHLLLTRAGQYLLWTPYRDAAGRLLLGRLPARLPRQVATRVLADAADRAAGLSALGLRPDVSFSRSQSLVTDGFFEALAAKRLALHRDRSVARLGAGPDGPEVELTDGSRLAADVVVAATGYDRSLDFIDRDTLAGVEHDGGLRFHRRTLAVDVPRLSLAGWALGYHSPLTAEVSATWLAAVLMGRVAPPPLDEQAAEADHYPLRRRSDGTSSTADLAGTTLGDLDRLLAEAGAPMPWRARVRQWWRPLDPAEYAGSIARARRLGRVRTR